MRFDWGRFFDEMNGGEYIESLREQWKDSYDVTLIDSRTLHIMDHFTLPTHKLEELLPALRTHRLIDAPIGTTERQLGDTLVDRGRPTPLDEAMEEETRRSVAAVLHELPDRQRIILSMRHGIGCPRECTLEEIGEALGLSRERIRQVERSRRGFRQGLAFETPPPSSTVTLRSPKLRPGSCCIAFAKSGRLRAANPSPVRSKWTNRTSAESVAICERLSERL